MALGKKLMNVNTTEKISGAENEAEKETSEPEKIPAEQRSLKEILDELADEEFIVTVPVGRKEEEHE